MSGAGIPIPRPVTAADILLRLTGAAALAAGSFLIGQGTATLASTGTGLTFASSTLTTRPAATQDGIALTGRAGGSSTYTQTLTTAALTGNRTATFPDAAITVAGSAAALTSGRVPFVTTGGLLTDAANLSFATGTGILTLGSAAQAYQSRIDLNAAAAQNRGILWQSGSLSRWFMFLDTAAESGSDTGATFTLRAYTDAGASIDSPLTIVRASGGAITLARPVACSSTLSATSLTASGLTSGRVPFVTTGGLLTDSAALLYAGGVLTVGAGTGTAILRVDGAAGTERTIAFRSGGVGRWDIYASNAAESGSDAGTALRIAARTDAGAYIDDPVVIARASGGAIELRRPVTCTSSISATSGTFTSTITATRASSGNTAQTISVAGDANARLVIAASGTHVWGDGTAAGDTTLSRSGVGQLTLAGSGMIFPNGTAAAPGIRTTTYVHGLYSATANGLGISVAGVAAAVINATGTGYGGGLQLKTTADADYTYIWGDRINAELRISAGNASDNGGTIRLFGTGHATASTGRLYSTSNIRFSWDGTGIGFFAATPVARPSLAAATGTATRTTFDTTTVTLPQLAERVKAMIDDLRSYGLAA
jgi:hypothetical protein